MLYHVVQLGLRCSLHKGVSQITPAGWVVQAPAASGQFSRLSPMA